MDTKRIKRNRIFGNKGVSLVELVVAMALFIIVIIPVCASFITSIRVNQKSRRMMAANDVAQSVMEGFSNKTYEGVKKSINNIALADLSGNEALSTVSGNVFNLKDSGLACSWTNMTNVTAGITSLSQNEISWKGTKVATPLLISENKAEAASMNRAAALDFKSVIDASGKDYRTPMLLGVTNTDENLSFLCYTGLHSEGYYFDAVVQFVPMANTLKQKYYSYEAMIYIYEIDKTDLSTRLNDDPVLTLMTGIKNRNG